MAYQPLVYKTSGGDQLVVSTGGVFNIAGGTLKIAGTDFITSGGNIVLGSLTSGNINTTGSVIATSGITGSSGTFTNGITGSSAAITNGITGSSLAITNGITGSSLAITNGITGSSLAITNGITGSSLAITNGITGSSLAITNGITGSSVSLTGGIAASTGTFTGGIALTSGIIGTTGQFSGAVAVGGNLTANLGFVRYLESPTSSASSIAAYGISIVKSTEDAEHVMSMAAPAAGIEKYIVCNEVLKSSGVSTGAAIITSSGAGAAIGTNTSILFTTGAVNNQWIHLIGQNSTNWVLIGQSTDVTLSST